MFRRTLHCSFCGKDETQVSKLVAGPKVYICDACVATARQIMLTLGNYLTPTLLGGKNSLWFTEQIYTQFITRFNWEQGAAFGFLLLALSTVIVWLGLRISGQRFDDVMRRA